MSRLTIPTALVGTSLLVSLAHVSAASSERPAPADGWQSPMLPEPLPDPALHRQGRMWYVTGTARRMYSAPTLTSPAWKRHTLSFDFGDYPRVQLWSFSLYRHTDGAYHGYGTLHLGWFRTVIAHFLPQTDDTDTSPDRPPVRWRLDKVLVGDVADGRCTFYDSKVYRLDDGSLVLVYNGASRPKTDVSVFGIRLRTPGEIDPGATPIPLLVPDDVVSEYRNPGYHVRICEGTTICRVGGMYVLVYSVGDFAASNYKVGVAYSDTFLPGPEQTYRKVRLADTANVWRGGAGEMEVCYLLQSQTPAWANYCGAWIRGPGIGTIVQEGGRHWLVCHGYPAEPGRNRYEPEQRMVYRLPLRVRIGPDRPMHEWITPVLPE